MLHKIAILDINIHSNFNSYNFHNLYKELLNFCTVDLSSFYFDIRKDTLYCDDEKSIKREGCIKILNIILDCLIKWFAPILTFTTEEIFKIINKNNKSIHLENFPKIPSEWKNSVLANKWEELLKIRDYCNISLENKRSEKEIGSSLEAKVELKLKNNLFEKFSNFDFEELLIISSANVINDDSIKDDIQVSTTKANGKKCPICWKIRSDECERHGKIN